MATDVGVQFFSHLNGLVLDNNWGDMIRLLDTCLVNGKPLTSITSASIDAQGDIHLATYAAHNCMLFQIIELTGFAPVGLNGKYRIKGVPDSTNLILKAELTGAIISTVGAAKLASLDYEIIFRDVNDVKRVYRAKNPRAEHPFIRVDETINDGNGNSYNSSYAKSAMVGLIENMTHIDDYADPDKLQLPLDTSDFTKNWKITGSGDTVIRGWSKWYWARAGATIAQNNINDIGAINGGRQFTLIGDKDAFYIALATTASNNSKVLRGCGLFKSILPIDVIQNWFLAANIHTLSANINNITTNSEGGIALTGSTVNNNRVVFLAKYDVLTRVSNHVLGDPICPDSASGSSNRYSGNLVSALEIPISDTLNRLRGSMLHACYSGKSLGVNLTTPILSDKSMYVYDILTNGSTPNGGMYFYLGELE